MGRRGGGVVGNQIQRKVRRRAGDSIVEYTPYLERIPETILVRMGVGESFLEGTRAGD